MTDICSDNKHVYVAQSKTKFSSERLEYIPTRWILPIRTNNIFLSKRYTQFRYYKYI